MDLYKGEMLDVRRNGWGTFKNSEGVYVGEWKNDKKEGKGKMTYYDKSKGVYEGEWKNNWKNGRGVLIKNGKRYESEWVNDNEVSYISDDDKKKRKAGKFYDADGNYKGRIDSDGNMYDEHECGKGKIDSDGKMYDEYGWDKGRIDDSGNLYDKRGWDNGRYQNGEIKDKSGNIVGRFRED